MTWIPEVEFHRLPWPIYRHLWWHGHTKEGEYHGQGLTEVQRLMVDSALARGDEETAEMYLRDWKYMPSKPEARVSKFVPGSHYHVLNEKFDTYNAARCHAESHGYRVVGLREVFVYTRDGG